MYMTEVNIDGIKSIEVIPSNNIINCIIELEPREELCDKCLSKVMTLKNYYLRKKPILVVDDKIYKFSLKVPIIRCTNCWHSKASKNNFDINDDSYLPKILPKIKEILEIL